MSDDAASTPPLAALPPEVVTRVAEFIGAGASEEAVAGMLGLDTDAFLAALAAGEQGDPAHAALAQAVADARTRARLTAEVTLRKDRPASWLAWQEKRRAQRAQERSRSSRPPEKDGTSGQRADRAGLTHKQERFVRSFALLQNATQAAKAAGYSEKTAHVTGPLLLEDPRVAAAIERIYAAAAVRSDVRRDKVVKGLAEIAFADIGDVLDFTGQVPRLKRAEDIPAHARRAIVSMKVRRYIDHKTDRPDVEVLEFKFADKVRALELLAKHTGVISSGAFQPGAGGMFPFGGEMAAVATESSTPPVDFSDLAAEYRGRLMLAALAGQVRSQMQAALDAPDTIELVPEGEPTP